MILPNTTQAKSVSCIGSEEVLDPSKAYPMWPATPRLARSYMFKISRLNIIIPERLTLETNLKSDVQSGVRSRDASKVQILSKNIKIGTVRSF